MARIATRTVAPASEPITVAEARKHLLLSSDVTGHDDWITDTITAIREHWEHSTETACILSTWVQTYDTWPSAIRLMRRPVSSVTSITYRDTSGNLQTLSSTNYRLDTGEAQPRIVWDDTAVLPALDVRPEAVTVTYVAGYADAASVPKDIKHALKELLTQKFEQRAGQVQSNMRAGENAVSAFMNMHARSTYP